MAVNRMQRFTVPVLGNPRGGTSATAGLLRLLGVPMGEAIQDATHEDMRLHTVKETVFKEVVKEYDRKWSVWGWKDPTFIDRYDILVSVLRNPRPLIVLRMPEECARSAVRHPSSFEFERELKMAEERFELLQKVDGLHFWFDDLIDNPKRTVNRIAAHVQKSVSVVDWPRIENFLDYSEGYKKLNHLLTDA